MLSRNYLITILCLALSGCISSTGESNIITVTGAISPSEMGIALIHEHILVDFIGANKTGYHRWDRAEVVAKVLPYLEEVKAQGVNTLLECSPTYLGRDPILLKMLSEKSGLKIITNTGYYGAAEDKYIPSSAYQVDAQAIADIWINEFEYGIEGTDIHPGFIKISVDDAESLSAIDEKIVRAAIITHQQTGLTIVSHTTVDGAASAQLGILAKAGVSPQSWVWTHAQAGSPELRVEAGRRGAWISLDNVSKDNFEGIVNLIENLKSAGLLNRVLISHDAGWFDPETPGGGEFRGYTDIFVYLLPALKAQGFTQREIDQILIENPRDAYKIKKRVE